MNGQNNPFQNAFGGAPNPFANIINMVAEFNNFRNQYQGNGQQAQQQAQQIIQQVNMPQNVFNQYAAMANQIMGMLGRR